MKNSEIRDLVDRVERQEKRTMIKAVIACIIVFIAMLFISSLTSCATLDKYHADWTNPCTNSVDCAECMEWKRTYPKEYKRYVNRMKKRSFVNYCKNSRSLNSL